MPGWGPAHGCICRSTQNRVLRDGFRTGVWRTVIAVTALTKEQGRSGLGIEAQREAVARFAAAEGFKVAAEFIEIESGKGSDALDRRPQLAAALAEARRLGRGTPIAVAKLDRLSRDVYFISGLMAHRVPFVSCGARLGR